MTLQSGAMELIVVVVVVAVLAWLVAGVMRRSRIASPESQLARMFSRDAAERLIQFERQRDPSLSRAQAARRALDRAEYDRGR